MSEKPSLEFAMWLKSYQEANDDELQELAWRGMVACVGRAEDREDYDDLPTAAAQLA